MTVQYDRNSFIIQGERVFLNSAAIHYFRMPKEEWRDVLLKAKLAGMNCIDTYFAWNIHEAEEGKFDFTGDKDCGEFLDLCAELGLWVIARPGPFICAEWDFGGFPWWLATKQGIEYRIDNELYMSYVERYFEQLIPIIAQRQLTNGGSVILVQVENEYGYLADSQRGKRYMAQLKDIILAQNITVPLITCVGGAEETIECANFWSGAKDHYAHLVEKQPDTPKIVTEFWTGWFENWGGMSALQKTPLLFEKRILEVIAAGFDGINHYMFYGGTNFGNYGGRTVGNSDIFMITSYDYHAPLDEYGRATSKYFVAKKLAHFTQPIKHFLLEAKEADHSAVKHTGKLNLQMIANGSNQRMLFVESLEEERNVFHMTIREGVTLPITLEAGQMSPVLDQIEVYPGLRLTMGGYLLANEHYQNRQTLIVAGGKGERLAVLLEGEAGKQLKLSGQTTVRYQALHQESALLLDLFLFEEPQVLTLTYGDRSLELIVLNEQAAEQSWNVKHNGIDWLIGYEDVSIRNDGALTGVQSADRTPLYVSSSETKFGEQLTTFGPSVLTLPKLQSWQTQSLDLSNLSEQAAEQPKGFAGMNKDFGYVVYTHQLHSEQNGKTTLGITGIQDPARVYVNGVEQGVIKDLGASSFEVELQAGHNELQFVVQHMGRLNFSPFLGEEKGIFGAVYRDIDVIDFRAGWSIEEQKVNIAEVTAISGQPLMKNTFTARANQKAILVGVLSETMIINGQKVDMTGYANWFKFGTVDISAFVKEGTNEIEMQYVLNPVQRLDLILCDEHKELTAWKMGSIAEAYPEATSASSAQGPAWHRTQFEWEPAANSEYIRLKLRMTGMSKGILLLNGISVGRYWQVGPQEDYKLPIAWLKQGLNTIEIFDEQGLLPNQVKIIFDKKSHNVWTEIK